MANNAQDVTIGNEDGTLFAEVQEVEGVNRLATTGLVAAAPEGVFGDEFQRTDLRTYGNGQTQDAISELGAD